MSGEITSAGGNTRSTSLLYGGEQRITGATSLTLLDGGIGDHDHADSETDTAVPDDDIASLASCSFESLTAWFSSNRGGLFLAGDGFMDDFANESVPRSPVSPFNPELENILEPGCFLCLLSVY